MLKERGRYGAMQVNSQMLLAVAEMTTLSMLVNGGGHPADPRSWHIVDTLCDVGLDDFSLHCDGHVLLSARMGSWCHPKTTYLDLMTSETKARSNSNCVDLMTSRDS